MLIEKKLIFEPGILMHEFWLCGSALQLYLKSTTRKKDQQRTYYTKKKTEKIFIRERIKNIHIKYIKYKYPKRYVSGKATVIG